MSLIKKIALFVLLAFSSMRIEAQNLPLNIEALSDEQILQLVSQYQLNGLSEIELQERARERGLSTDQIAALKKRMALLDISGKGVPANENNNRSDSYSERSRILTRGPLQRKRDSTENVLMVFGEDIFDNLNLSFEPNNNVASPGNYIIGVNDELVVDVFGLSENTRKLKVSPEGTIRYPNLGPIRVAGLSMEAAETKIRQSLTAIYPAISAGRTKVAVSLGQIRSIRVTVIGEVNRPGNYTMSSLSSLMHALYACGGPNKIGTLRQISLVRGGKKLVEMDLYDFLLKGDLSGNLLLQEGDVVKLSPYQHRVAIKGAVKRPALYDLKNGDNAASLLDYAGGFTDKAMKAFVRIRRWGAASREVLTLPVNALSTMQLVSGDTLYVDSLSRQFVNRVMIQGAVEYPGEYGLNYVQDLKTLVEFAKPAPQALLERAILVRRKEDFQPAYFPFSVQETLQGKSNMKLQSEDSIYLYKRTEVREPFTVIINGEVNKPDTFAYAEGMRVQDLILLAGGLKDGASLQRIEISRRLRKATENGRDTSTYAVIKAIDLQQGIDFQNNELDFVLEPFDMVGIRKAPGYKEQITVTIEGQVMYPGTYTLSGNRERLSDIITRAGGLRNAAYPRGALLVRKTYPGVGSADAAVFSNKLNLSASKQKLTEEKEEKAPLETLYSGDTLQLRNMLNEVAAQQKPVAIRLEEALRKPGSSEDIFLEEGDVLKVPKQLQTVQTFGAVNIRQQLAYRPGISVPAMIRQSGGFSTRADRKRLYVVNADGTVKSTREIFFVKVFPRLQPGSEIYVPEQRETKKLSPGELLSLSSGIISLGGLIIALLNVIR